MRFWTRDAKGDRKETGVSYVGESKRVGDAWVSHGHGKQAPTATDLFPFPAIIQNT